MAPNCVLGSQASSTYPHGKERVLARLGWAGADGYASGACVACGLVVRHFEHPLF